MARRIIYILILIYRESSGNNKLAVGPSPALHCSAELLRRGKESGTGSPGTY
jgi:hypothetical protein